jgi:hypothetical protein
LRIVRNAPLSRGPVQGTALPISYRIDDAGNVVHVSFRGLVTVDQFRAHRAALTGDRAFRPSMHRLTDVRELTELPSMDDLRDLAHVSGDARKREPEGVRRGVIVGSPAAYGAIRQYQAFLWFSGLSVDILAGNEEVQAWLAGLPAEQTGNEER